MVGLTLGLSKLTTSQPMSLNASMLAKVAKMRGADIDNLTRLIGDKYAERFGDAFLEVLEGE